MKKYHYGNILLNITYWIHPFKKTYSIYITRLIHYNYIELKAKYIIDTLIFFWSSTLNHFIHLLFTLYSH